MQGGSMSLDGLTQGAPGPEQPKPGQDQVIVPVQDGAAVEAAKVPDLTVNTEVAGTEASAIPGGAPPLEVDQSAAIDAANQDVIAAAAPADKETVVDADGDEQGEPVAVNVTDPNAAAHAAMDNAGTVDGAADLELIIGGQAKAPVEPARAPEISAFPEKGLDVPPARTVTPDTATASAQSVNAPDFASPYPLPGKAAETAATDPAAPQTFINMSGLPGTPPSPAAEPQTPAAPTLPAAPAEHAPIAPEAQAPTEPAAPAEEPAPQPEAVEAPQDEVLSNNPDDIPVNSRDEREKLEVVKNNIVVEMADLTKQLLEVRERIQKPLTDIGSDFHRQGELNDQIDALLKKHAAARERIARINNPEAKTGEVS